MHSCLFVNVRIHYFLLALYGFYCHLWLQVDHITVFEAIKLKSSTESIIHRTLNTCGHSPQSSQCLNREANSLLFVTACVSPMKVNIISLIKTIECI